MSLEQNLTWVTDGTALFETAAHGVEDFAAASALPGWSRAHVITHVARNADALNNLLTWARTGEETPMYAPGRRDADIEAGARRPGAELLADLGASHQRLALALSAFPADRWSVQVRTGRGRWIPVTLVPWLRAREVWIHAVDLDVGRSFDDLPAPLVEALLDEAVAGFNARDDIPALSLEATDLDRRWKLGPGADPAIKDTVAGLTAYVLGRTTNSGLPDWP